MKDVVTYFQDVFLPAWEKLGPTLHKWGDTGLEVILAWAHDMSQLSCGIMIMMSPHLYQ